MMKDMGTERHPDPDAILNKLYREHGRQGKGKLKIFFGYAAGVGKTYAMLEDAHEAKKAGADVVAGYIEPHTRPETMALLEGLEVLPPLVVPYKGMELQDFDLDSALRRKPQLILVDELAHTNAKGMRHTKRYSDIEELLDAGIHVYTTVNVQHIESLNDLVASITQVVVQERVPDSIFDRADQLELVDIEPEELLQRLKAGKIYKENHAKRAMSHFFTQDNLVALREISLRYTADQVNQELEIIKKARRDGSRYQIDEHILVCVGPSPTNQKVIRTAARMAGAFHGRFTAIYVETPGSEKCSEEEKRNIRKNLHLAETLGAKVVTTYSDDISYQIVEFARVSGISKLVIGRTRKKKGISRFFLTKSNFVDRMISLAPDLELFVIPDERAGQVPRKMNFSGFQDKFAFSIKDFSKMLGIMTLSILIGHFFEYLGLREANIIIIMILGVLVTANQTKGRFYGVMASLLGVLGFNFFFTDPRFTLYSNAESPITFLIMLTSALITSTLTSRARSQAVASALNVYRTEVLLDANNRLQNAKNLDDIVIETERQIYKIVKKPIIFYTVEEGEIANIYSYDSERERPVDPLYMGREERGVVNWVLRNKKKAGKGTDTLPGAKAHYIPIRDGYNEIMAIIGLIIDDTESMEDIDRSLLGALLGQITFALDTYYTAQEQQETEVRAEKERFRANLLRSISHDLRTPLTSISGSASSLLSTDFDQKTKTKLIQGIYDDSVWLIDLVENLLSLSRLDDNMQLRKEPELLEEVIEEAMTHITKNADSHHIEIEQQDPMLMAEVELTLMIQVIVNLVNNAVQHTPEGSNIVIRTFRQEGKAVVQVEDNGAGIPDQDKDGIFDLFFTARHGNGDSHRGMGLGLALCKSIVEAHNGKIYAQDNEPKGAIFGFTLPLVEVKENENFNSNR